MATFILLLIFLGLIGICKALVEINDTLKTLK